MARAQVRAWVSKIDSGETELHAGWYAARFEELGVDGGRLLHAVDTRFLIDNVGMKRLRRVWRFSAACQARQAEATSQGSIRLLEHTWVTT